ncbi:MAG: phosphohydrolase [Flavobacteriales bacterium]|nr:phosphohydrolase [Flavobacteriales bacterium]
MEHLHLLETAIRLAAKVHRGQVDRFGNPYVMHVMRVMMRGHDLEEQILGALHDVLERSDLTVDDIAKKGFPPRVLKALQHITRVEPETYEQYIDRVVQDNLAIRVKLHDLADKMDLLHVEQLDPADLKRYNRQLAAYHRMKKLVEEAKANMPIGRAGQGAVSVAGRR